MFFYNLRSLVVHWRRYIGVVLIVAVATGSFLVLGTALDSFAALVKTSTERDNVVLLSRGMYAESFPELGRVPKIVLPTLAAFPTVAAGPDGAPLVSPEYTFTPEIEHKGRRVRITVRGVTASAFDVHRIVVGRPPTDGVIMGTAVRALLPDLAPGDEVTFAGRSWKVSGTFAPRSEPTQFDSELWAPAAELMQARQTDEYGTVFMKARSPMEVASLVSEINATETGDLANYRAVPESTLNSGAEDVLGAFRAVHLTFSILLMGVAGLGTVNILLHNAFRRRRDMALIRALGSSSWRVAGGFVYEGLIVAAIGAILGALLALTTSGVPIVTASSSRPGMTVFRLHYEPGLLLQAVVIGALLGALCAVLPAWYSSRFRVRDELRAE